MPQGAFMSGYEAVKSGLYSIDIGSILNVLHYNPDSQILQL
jgi:hypothetical protein